METPEDKAARYEQMVALQAERKAKRKPTIRQSRLDRFQAEIEDFADNGIGPTDIAEWLAKHKRVRVHSTTIIKRLATWRDDAKSP